MSETKDYLPTGEHVIFDLYGINKEILLDNDFIKDVFQEAIHRSGANICQYVEELFEPSGITFVYVLSESHCSCHTYPSHGVLMGCIHTCGERIDPVIAVQYIQSKLQPQETRIIQLERGNRDLGIMVIGD